MVFAHVMAQSRVAAPWVFAHVTAQSLGWQPCGFLPMLQLSLWSGSPVGFCTCYGLVSGVAAPWAFAR